MIEIEKVIDSEGINYIVCITIMLTYPDPVSDGTRSRVEAISTLSTRARILILSQSLILTKTHSLCSMAWQKGSMW